MAGCLFTFGTLTSLTAGPVIVNDVTDWSTTPNEVVNVSIPYLNYNGGVYAGINTLSVNNNGNVMVYDGFCVDPFHWSVSGPVNYNMVPLANAPKLPGTLNAGTATEISELWAEFFSPTMTSASAAGLQIAVWELVSSNAVASGNLAPNMAFSLAQGQPDYGASADIAALATFSGPAPYVVGLTGPGQDYIIDPVPDGGQTLLMLGLTGLAMLLARPFLLARAPFALKPCRVSANSNH